MFVPDKAQRLGLCLGLSWVTALVLTIFASDARASILEELRAMTSLADAGTLDRSAIEFTPRSVDYTVRIPVHGANERRQMRNARWQLFLAGDRRAVFDRHGWPTHRHRVDSMGIVTEHWSYPAERLTLVFRDDRLIETRRD